MGSVVRIAVILLVWAVLPAAAQDRVITLAGDDWCPYNCEQNATLPGYGVELAEAIYEKAGYTVEYRVVPWNRAVIECRAGHFTAVIAAVPDEVDGFIFPDESIGRIANDFFVRAGDPWRFKGMDSLLFMRIGVVKGYDYNPEFNNYFIQAPKGKVFYSSGVEPVALNLKMLLGNRLDLIVSDRNVVRWYATRAGLRDKIDFAGSDYVFREVYIAFSPMAHDALKLADIFTQGVREMRDSGELLRILEKYGVEDWK